MNEKRSRPPKEKSAMNWWKWAFISLFTLLLIGLFWLIHAVQPVRIDQEDAEQEIVSVDEEVALVSNLTKEDAATIMNIYLETVEENEVGSYEIVLEDQLEIQARVDIFQWQVPYTLSFEPLVTENGNLQLRADTIELSSFTMPVSTVLSVLANELDLPPFIGVDSGEQMILIDFNKLSEEYDVGVTMEKIDLENNEIELKLSLNKDTLLETMKFEKNFKKSMKKNRENRECDEK